MSMKLNTINWWTFALSVFCILFLALFKEAANPLIKRKIKFEFPSELVLVGDHFFINLVVCLFNLNCVILRSFFSQQAHMCLTLTKNLTFQLSKQFQEAFHHRNFPT